MARKLEEEELPPVQPLSSAELPGNRIAVAIVLEDPGATEAKNWAQQAGVTVEEWLNTQVNHALFNGMFPVV